MTSVDAFITRYHDPAPWGMMDRTALRVILTALSQTHDVPGDLVELGCHEGSTSVFLQRYVETYLPQKALHVYDAFQGLPERRPEDGPDAGRFVTGACRGAVEQFRRNFERWGQRTFPTMHVGWFETATYPPVISFAFFDSDRYQSITDSFTHVWPRLSVGGRVVVHDMNLVGCGARRACEHFGHPWTEDYGCAILVKTA